jgi:hypothetical protein
VTKLFCGRTWTTRNFSGPQDNTTGLTNALETFEQFLYKGTVQKIVTDTNCYAEKLKDSRDNIFYKQFEGT